MQPPPSQFVTHNITNHEEQLKKLHAPKKWQHVGAFLLQRRDKKDFGDRSFTDFMRSLAETIGVAPATLWNHLVAIEIYESWRVVYGQTNFPSPDAESFSARETAILFADKIRAVTPPAVHDEICQRAMRGTIGRTELQRLWRTYNTAPGLNRRGRSPGGRSTASVSRSDAPSVELDERGKIMEVLALRGLPEAMEVKNELVSIIRIDGKWSWTWPKPDAIAIAGSGKADEVAEIHVLYFTETSGDDSAPPSLPEDFPCSAWLLALNDRPHGSDPDDLLASTSLHWGINHQECAKFPIATLTLNLMLKSRNNLR